MKRLFDILFSLVCLFLLFIPFVLISILIKIDSKGPVFFMQERIGLHKRKFLLFKFRTMTNKTRIIKQVYSNDPEITKIGKYLRRYKIDELPQLFNVLIGDMSVVGPRPCVEFVANKYNLCKERFLNKPGLTSLAGVSGSIYLSWEEKDYYDKYYFNNRTILLDINILMKTFLVVVLGEQNFVKKPKIN